MKFRKAEEADLLFIVEMLAEDALGLAREDFRELIPARYRLAFLDIDRDPNQELMVVEDDQQNVIGTLQLTFIPYLTYRGGIRAQVEAVRVHKDHRGKGIGKEFFLWAINRAKERGAHMIQLTTNKKRGDAIRFYENLGFTASHDGMKLHF